MTRSVSLAEAIRAIRASHLPEPPEARQTSGDALARHNAVSANLARAGAAAGAAAERLAKARGSVEAIYAAAQSDKATSAAVAEALAEFRAAGEAAGAAEAWLRQAGTLLTS